MRRILIVSLALLSLACPAWAGGVNFAWGSLCYAENPVDHLTFACNSNLGTTRMTASFSVDTEMTDFVGVEITVEGLSMQAVLPDWWKLGPTDCRANAMTFDADESGVATETCVDWTGGAAFNVFGYSYDTNRAHISAGAAIAASMPYDLRPGVEYYAGTFTLRNRKTVGDGACGGCAYGFVWGLALVTVAGLDGRRDDLHWNWDEGCLWWNNTVMCCPLCPLPAKETTWGQVKTLYR
jgi:hypothetical protein